MTADASGRIDNRNVASGSAHVGQQVGQQTVQGDANTYDNSIAYHNSIIYTLTEGDGPERRQEVAVALLSGGVPRRAEELLRRLVREGHASTRTLYHYVLSVLGDRGFRDLVGAPAAEIREALRMCASAREDEWTRALGVVRDLLEQARSDTGTGDPTAVAGFAALGPDRQDEIGMHLSQLRGGAVEQQLGAERAREVGAGRTAGNRRERAWKYFEPEPAPPVVYRPWIAPPERGVRARVVLGGLVAVAATVGLVLGPMALPSWIGVLLLAVGSVLVVRHGTELAVHPRYAELRRDAVEPASGTGGPTAVDRLVERSFRDACPEYAQDWPRYAAGYKDSLRQRLDAQLPDDDQAVKRVKWLVDWHARRVARRWPHHDPHRPPDHAAPGARRWRAVGALLAVAGVLLLLAAQRWPVVPLAGGGWLALSAVVGSLADRCAVRLLLQEADALFAEETVEYHRRRDELADTPADGEMARWLALDKAYLKAQALHRGDIAEQDLVAHVVIDERAPGARRGRVPHGPLRYTAYLVTVILLTRHGARISRMFLDFTTGETRNENWRVFGYDRIASASLGVVERTVRKAPHEPVRTVHSREFRLSLLSGEEILQVNDRVEAEGDARADEVELQRLTAATSGMDAALPILEAVARQGREWIDLDRDRRKLLFSAWAD